MIILRWLGSYSPEIIEQVYSRGAFLGIRKVLDILLGWLPFSWLYLMVPTLIFGIGWGVTRYVRKWNNRSLQQRILIPIWTILSFVLGTVGLFLFIWGFNYGRVQLEDQIGIKPEPLHQDTLWQELEKATVQLKALRAALPVTDTTAYLDASHLPEDYEKHLRDLVEKTLTQLGYPDVGSPAMRHLWPKGILLRISTAGFYLPFTGECNADLGLHPLQKPFIVAHEYAHAYAITDEGSCNFIAYLACQQSEYPAIRYMGYLSYWRYLASSSLSIFPKRYQSFRKTLPKGIQADLNIVNETMALYPDILPRFRDATYDAYLKVQGVQEGLKSYSRIVMLVYAWEGRGE